MIERKDFADEFDLRVAQGEFYLPQFPDKMIDSFTKRNKLVSKEDAVCQLRGKYNNFEMSRIKEMFKGPKTNE